MARVALIAGNWKMNKGPAEAAELARALVGIPVPDGIEVLMCPPAISIPAVAEAARGTLVGVGAQNIHWEPSGAFTGEIAAPMLAGVCQYVIIGHSERRQYFGETDQTVNQKVRSALAHGVRPIICVGELLEENEAGKTAEVVQRQVRAAFAGLSAEQAAECVVAYEPVWAIGTGKTATGGAANAVCGLHIRGVVADLFGNAVADGMRIQYGGSVKSGNVAEFAGQPDIDGALVGGASLKVDSFRGIIEGWAAAN